jgi:hypothetical protein
MQHDLSATSLRQCLRGMPDLDLLRARYCYQIGSTFVAAALLEDSVIHAMLLSDRVKVPVVLGADASAWDRLLKKQKHLQDSTLGALISILSKHALVAADIAYLKWLKSKRDFFIHRYFHAGPWPGDLDEDDITLFCRTLGFLEIIFHRGADRMVGIFSRAGLIQLEVFPGYGTLAINPGLFDDED